MVSHRRSKKNPFRRCCQVLPRYGIRVPECTRLFIWTCGMVLLIGLTVKDFLPLITEYTYHNVATQVEVVIGDQAFKPPQIVICLPHYQVQYAENEDLANISQHLANGTEKQCEKCQNLATQSWDVWTTHPNFTHFRQKDPEVLYNALSLALAKKIFTEDNKTEVFHPKNALWNKPILAAAIAFFIWHHNVDYYFQPFDIGPELNISAVIDKTMTAQKLDPIFAKTIGALCQEMELSAWLYSDDYLEKSKMNRTCEQFLLNTTVPVCFDTQGLWYPLPPLAPPKTTEFKFSYARTDDAVMNLASNDSVAVANPNADEKSFLVFTDASIQYSAIFDPVAAPIYEIPQKYVVTKEGSGHFITILYSVQMRARETRAKKTQTCHNESNPTTCFTKCTKLWLIEKCGCVPFSYKDGLGVESKHLPYCHAWHMEKCKPKNLPHEQKEKCLTKCKDACEYTSYNYQISHQIYEPEDPGIVEFKLRMDPMLNTFAEFSWVIKDTQEQFISQLGGILNFYLGISGLTIFALIAALFDFLHRIYYRCERKKKIQAELDEVKWKQPDQTAAQGFEPWQTGSGLMAQLEARMQRVIEEKVKAQVDSVLQIYGYGRRIPNRLRV